MTQTKKTLKETYNKIASHFDKTRKKPWKPVEEFIDTQKKSSILLDLAAGTGRHALYAKKNSLYSIAGDFSINQLKELKNKDSSIPIILLDLEHLPFKENSIDSITYIAAIHHLDTKKSRLQSLKEALRILKPGSQILTSAWSLDQPRFIGKLDKNNNIKHTWNKQHPRFYHLFKENELEELHKQAGLKSISSFREKDNYYTHSCKMNLIKGIIKIYPAIPKRIEN